MAARHDGRSGDDCQVPGSTSSGESLELKVVLEKRYSEELLHSKGRGKLVAEKPTAPSHKPVTLTPPRLTKIGQGEALKLHFKRAPTR